MRLGLNRGWDLVLADRGQGQGGMKRRQQRVDQLCEEIQGIAAASEKNKSSRATVLAEMWRAAKRAAGYSAQLDPTPVLPSRATVPYLNEPWYC